MLHLSQSPSEHVDPEELPTTETIGGRVQDDGTHNEPPISPAEYEKEYEKEYEPPSYVEATLVCEHRRD